jgi:hypothetical protein
MKWGWLPAGNPIRTLELILCQLRHRSSRNPAPGPSIGGSYLLVLRELKIRLASCVGWTALLPPWWGSSAVPVCKRCASPAPRRGFYLSRPATGQPWPPMRRQLLASFYATALTPSKGRLIRCTVLGSTPKRAAILRTPSARPGVLRAARICLSSSAGIRGRPSCLPSSLALRRPARTRSWIIDRSNSANTPIIWNSAFPAGVVVSNPADAGRGRSLRRGS